MIDRRALVLSGLACLALSGRARAGDHPVMVVYKSPTCGCCGAWIEHVEAAGFRVAVRNMPDVVPVKTEFGVPQALWSCPHGPDRRLYDRGTCARRGYPANAGHPAADCRYRGYLACRHGSPGMEVPGYSEPYDVYAFSGDNLAVFASHEG